VLGFMIFNGPARLEFLLGEIGFYRPNLIQRIVLQGSLVAPGYDLHVGGHCLGVLFPKAIALSALRLLGQHLGGHLSGVSQQTVEVLRRLELVAVGFLLAFDTVGRPGYCGQPLGVDFLVAMQTGPIRIACYSG
jgi:hypothetical protein